MILLDPKGKYSADALALAVKNAQVSCHVDSETVKNIDEIKLKSRIER